MIMPGDVIFHEGSTKCFVVLVVAATPDAVDIVHLFWRGKHVRRSMHTVLSWLTCDMGYTLLRNGRPVTIVTSVV